MNDYFDEQLQFSRDYDITGGMIEHLQEIWHWPDYPAYSQDHRAGYLKLRTGGGNEDAPLTASAFWLMYWKKSERGGHYCFEIPEVRDGNKEG
jgi:hypothetical protein